MATFLEVFNEVYSVKVFLDPHKYVVAFILGLQPLFDSCFKYIGSVISDHW